MMKKIRLIISTALLLSLFSCGIKDDLYLEDSISNLKGKKFHKTWTIKTIKF